MAKNVKCNNIGISGSIWMTVGDKSLGGSGRVELLSQIAMTGSISQAAKNMKMSYKAAWDAIDHINNLAGQPLVEKATGGKGGGGTHLTLRGERLIRTFRAVEEQHAKFLDFIGEKSSFIAEDILLLRRILVKTSARNQLLGKVIGIKSGAVNDEVTLQIAGGQHIVAIITHVSTQDLRLTIGTEAFALIKASSVILVTDEKNVKFSARNSLSGIISSIQEGPVNTDVTIDLGERITLAAVVTTESAKVMGLSVGVGVSGIFKASSVILGTLL